MPYSRVWYIFNKELNLGPIQETLVQAGKEKKVAPKVAPRGCNVPQKCKYFLAMCSLVFDKLDNFIYKDMLIFIS